MCEVVSKKAIGALGPNDVYIGRAMPGLAESPFANPFKMRDGSVRERARVIVAYEQYIREKLNGDIELRRRLWRMRNKRLVCWCKPEPCHGDVLSAIIYEMLEGQRAIDQAAPDVECVAYLVEGKTRYYWRDGRVTERPF